MSRFVARLMQRNIIGMPNQQGITSIEYAFIVSIVSLAMLFSVASSGNSLNSLFGKVSNVLGTVSAEITGTNYSDTHQDSKASTSTNNGNGRQ